MHMKLAAFLLSVILPSFSIAQLEIVWSDPIVISDSGEMDGPHAPSVAVNDAGQVVVVYSFNDGGIIHTRSARLLDGSFTDDQQLSDGSMTYNAISFGPTIQAHENVLFSMYQYGQNGNIVTRKSTDGGVTWEDEAWADEFLWGDYAWFPKFDIDGEGHPHVSMLRWDGPEQDVGACCSVNLGDSYTLFIPASDDNGGETIAHPDIVIDGDKHLVTWRTYDMVDDLYRLKGALSTNNGATFGTEVVLHEGQGDSPGFGLFGTESFISGDLFGVIWSTEENWYTQRVAIGSLSDFGGAVDVYDMADGLEETVVQTHSCALGNDGLFCVMWADNRSGQNELYGSIGPNADDMQFFEVPNMNPDLERGMPEIAYHNGVLHVVYHEMWDGRVMYLSGEVHGLTQIDEPATWTHQVLPNPASSSISIVLGNGQSGMIRVFDASGNLVRTELINTPVQTLDISELPAGLYQVCFDNGECRSIVVQR